MVFQRRWRPEQAMIPSPVNSSTVPPKRCSAGCRTADNAGHDLAQPLGTHGGGDDHRVHHVGKLKPPMATKTAR